MASVLEGQKRHDGSDGDHVGVRKSKGRMMQGPIRIVRRQKKSGVFWVGDSAGLRSSSKRELGKGHREKGVESFM